MTKRKESIRAVPRGTKAQRGLDEAIREHGQRLGKVSLDKATPSIPIVLPNCPVHGSSGCPLFPSEEGCRPAYEEEKGYRFVDGRLVRDRDAQGVVPDEAKRNPEQPGPAKRASLTASERLRYRSLSTELKPWLKTLQGLAQGSDQGLALQALQAYVPLTGLLIALDMAGRTD